MGLIEVVETDSDYLDLKNSIIRGATRRYSKGDDSITRLTEVDFHEAESIDDSVWVVTEREYRPGDVRAGIVKTKYYDFQDFDLLRSDLPELRVKNLPPFRGGIVENERMPETDVASSSSFMIVRPLVKEYLIDNGEFDYDGLEDDLYAIQNEATASLAQEAREGIWQTQREKLQAIRLRDALDAKVNRAFRELTGYSPDIAYGRNRFTPQEKISHYRNLIESSGRETNYMRESGLDLDALELESVLLDVQSDEAGEVGREAFVETVRTNGMRMPESFGDEYEATDRLGLGSRGYLRL